MKVIEAPNQYKHHSPDAFLGGGITNCPDWQKELITLLADVDGTLLNPRRRGDYDDSIAIEQITWEYYALRSVPTVFFWFPEETLCPITLFELGVFTQREVNLVVGTHPNYARKIDVITQLRLARPEVNVVHTIADMATEYKKLIA